MDPCTRIDVKKLEAAIFNLGTSDGGQICDKARKGIKNLFEEGFGVKFKLTPPNLKRGTKLQRRPGTGIFSSEKYIVAFHDRRDQTDIFALIHIDTGDRWMSPMSRQDLSTYLNWEEWEIIEKF